MNTIPVIEMVNIVTRLSDRRRVFDWQLDLLQ
jgi:hypothetical protein